jgi:hypothetical protein
VANGEPNQPERQPAQRRFAASEDRTNAQVNRAPPPPEPAEPWESDPFGERPTGGGRMGSFLFGPREFAGGRVRVYGCSPGCIVVSLVVSVLLSVLLTVLLNLLL